MIDGSYLIFLLGGLKAKVKACVCITSHNPYTNRTPYLKATQEKLTSSSARIRKPPYIFQAVSSPGLTSDAIPWKSSK